MKSRRLDQTKPLPSPEYQKESRARWAEAALWEFRRHTGANVEDIVSDLLADIMHWCDRHAQNFDRELRRGREHYLCETDADF